MAASASGALLILRRACSSATEAAAAKPPGSGKARRKKNLVEVVQFLPDWGVGAKLAKGHWQPGTFYQLTRLQLGKDARHGAAWGVFHDSEVLPSLDSHGEITVYADGDNGAPKTGAEEKIGGVNKRVWKYLKDAEQKWKRL